jgi:hypothetical protein
VSLDCDARASKAPRVHRAAVLALAIAASAQAQGVLAIEVRAPSECTLSLSERTRAMLDGEVRAQAQVSIDHGADRWEADVVVAPVTGLPQHRHVAGERGAACSAIEDALVLVLVTMLEPFITQPEPPSCPSAPPCPAPIVTAPIEPVPPSDPLRIEAQAGPRLVWGLLPDTAVAGSASLAIAQDHWAAQLELSMLAPSIRAIDATRGISLWAWLVGTSICYRPLDDALFAIEGCARVDAGGVDASGFGFSISRHTLDAWIGAGASGAAALYWGPIAIGLEARLLAAFTLDYSRADGTEREVIYRSSPAVGSLGLWVRVQSEIGAR